MKKIIFISISVLFIAFSACKDNSTGGITNPFGNGGVGTGNSVTFTITSRQDQQGGTIFSASPNVAVRVSMVTASVPAVQYSESFQFDGTTVVNANVAEDFLQYPAGSGVASGQQWTFQFEGTIVSNNQAYNVTSNYTIP